MNMFLCRLALALLCASASSTFAASTVDLQVTGLITPKACNVLLSDDGVVDHETILAWTLNQTEFTVLPSQQMGLSISCDGAVLFALEGIDNKAASSLAPDTLYGLGFNPHAPTERLGSVALSLRGPVGDTQLLQTLGSPDKGTTWHPESNAYPGLFMGFARTGETLPSPVQQLVASLRVDTSISPANTLTLKEVVPLDGSITLDLIYL